MDFDQQLDASGLMCPMPVVKTARIMKSMTPGQVLKLIATDRGSVADIPAWTSDTGNELISSSVEGNAFVFFIRKA
jgi:tRNA 2-thiouridine synthesizing protein A